MRRIEVSRTKGHGKKSFRADSLVVDTLDPRPREITIETEGARRMAMAAGLCPATTMASAVDSAIARSEENAMVQGWLTSLCDVLGGKLHEDEARTLFAAACSGRLRR